MPLLLMGLALLVMALLGDLTLRLCNFSTGLTWWKHLFVVFWIGQALGTWLLWIIGISGLPMWTFGAVCFSFYLLVGYGFLWQKGKLQRAMNAGNFIDMGQMSQGARCFAGLWWLLLIAVCCFVIGIFIMAGMSYPVQGATGLGNWLFKAKWFLLSERWPLDYFAHGGHNRHLAYPPGFPLLTGWCAWVMGGLDVYWIRALPVLLLSAAFFVAATCLQRGLRGLASLLGLVILFTGYFGQVILWGFYAEPMLLFGLVVTILILSHPNCSCGNLPVLAMTLASLAWVKQEGLVLALLMSGFLWVKAQTWQIERGLFAKYMLIALGFWFIPWRIFAFLGQGKDENFSLGRIFENGNWDRLSQAWISYHDLLWKKGAYFGAAWWLIPLLCYVAMVQRGRLTLLLGTVSLAYVCVVIGTMTGSVQEDFVWHLDAATRVLLIPSFLLLLGFGSLNVRGDSSSKDAKLKI